MGKFTYNNDSNGYTDKLAEDKKRKKKGKRDGDADAEFEARREERREELSKEVCSREICFGVFFYRKKGWQMNLYVVVLPLFDFLNF